MLWNNKEVDYLNNNYSNSKDSQISKFLNKSALAIRIKASRLNLRKNSSMYRENLQLNESEEQIIIGGLLGDLHCRITHTSKNARLEGGHSNIQLGYLQYKADLLNRLKLSIRFGRDGVYYGSKSFPCLNQYYSMFYFNDRKNVNLEILNKIDRLGLLIWYLDDGNYHKRDKCSRLHTNCFTYEEHLIMQGWFRQKWNILPSIYSFKDQTGKIVHYLSFPVSETMKLHDLFKDFEIPECMKYKLYYNHESHLPKSIPGVLVAHN